MLWDRIYEEPESSDMKCYLESESLWNDPIGTTETVILSPFPHYPYTFLIATFSVAIDLVPFWLYLSYHPEQERCFDTTNWYIFTLMVSNFLRPDKNESQLT